MTGTREPQPARQASPQESRFASLAALNRAIAKSKPFVKGGTRAVLGEGPLGAHLAFVGEQPGDKEDLEGHPFVGPAGLLLTRAMEAAGMDRRKSYVTNAVKHFKYEQRGKRRIHQRPTAGEVKHYRWWLLEEIRLVHPRIVVAMGSTAALALSGRTIVLRDARGPFQFGAMRGFVTVHPSSLLRMPDAEGRRVAFDLFVSDLREAHAMAA